MSHKAIDVSNLSFMTKDAANKYRKKNLLKRRVVKQDPDGKWRIYFDEDRYGYEKYSDEVKVYKNKDGKFSKREYISIVSQLCYPESVIIAIKKAKTEEEITRIMTSARKGEYK